MTKRSLLVLALIVGGCNSTSTSKVPPGLDAATASGGSGGKGMGGSASTGGTTGLGGTSSAGGVSGSGGTTGTGGLPGSGGGIATGGSTGTGGATSSGGATGGAKGDAAVDARSDVSVGTGGGPATGGTVGGSGGTGTGGAAGMGGTFVDAGRDSGGDAKIDLQPDASGDGYAKPIAVPDGGTCPYTGRVSYTFTKSGDSTVDNLITTAMDQAIAYYNCYTNITKADKVEYDSSVKTADGNSNGTIRFGSDKGYMILRVAMHEISHTVGIGTASNWGSFVAIPAGGSSGPWTGANGIAQRQALLPDVWQQNGQEVLTADTQHFWPYGLNKAEDYKSEADLLGHCAMVMAMRKDMGM